VDKIFLNDDQLVETGNIPVYDDWPSQTGKIAIYDGSNHRWVQKPRLQ
jgi:hypothetical protein